MEIWRQHDVIGSKEYLTFSLVKYLFPQASLLSLAQGWLLSADHSCAVCNILWIHGVWGYIWGILFMLICPFFICLEDEIKIYKYFL